MYFSISLSVDEESKLSKQLEALPKIIHLINCTPQEDLWT